MRKYLFLTVMMSITFAACGGQEEITPTPEPLLPTATPVPTEAPTPTPRPTHTPIPKPELLISDQALGEDGILVIDSVVLPEEGWIAFYRNVDEAPNASNLITARPLTAGAQSELEISIDIMQARPEIAAVLHTNPDGSSTFNPNRGDILSRVTIELRLEAELPTIEVSDQDIGEEGILHVDHVYAREPGWLAIYNSESESAAELLGFTSVRQGENHDLTVPIRWREAVPNLLAVLHDDAGESGRFDPLHPVETTLDPMIINPENGEAVSAAFHVTLPPQIVVINQPIVDNQFVVERLISDGDGWLVAYQSNDGQPGFIIGSQPVMDGLNERIVVEVDGTAATDEILVTLHDDSGEVGEFDFPANDQLRQYNKQTFYVAFSTVAGPTLIMRDQPLRDKSVFVSVIVSEVDVWAVVHLDEAGELGEIVGRTWVSAGTSYETVVVLDSEIQGQRLHLVLYTDGGTIQEFEPDTADLPLVRRREAMAVLFEILDN